MQCWVMGLRDERMGKAAKMYLAWYAGFMFD
jgi:hypothetical protein